jgi:tetratricopeptide (TPR) repeat protein
VAVREPRLGEIAEVASAIQLASARDAKGLGRTVFFIGAGCSRSAGIPTVPDIARHMAADLAKSKRAPPDALKDSLQTYHWLTANKIIPECKPDDPPPKDGKPDGAIDWFKVYDTLFEKHYRGPDYAREIFSEFVDKAGGCINWAHLCLGELTKQRLVSTVITTNFDQLVLAGMVRAGVLPVVCDGIESLTRIGSAPSHPQLIELHGSRHTYRLRNHPSEVAEVITEDQVIGAIVSLFRELRVFVVVGYGGREKGIMDLLVRAARQFADKQLFWITNSADPKTLSPKAVEFLATSRNAALVVGQDADTAFLRLLKELGIGAPEAIRNPLFLPGLHASGLAPHDSADISDREAIAAEIARHKGEIETLHKALAGHRNKRTTTETATTKARELRLAGKLDEALKILRQASKRTKDLTIWSQLAEVASQLGETSSERKPLETAGEAWRRVLKATDRESSPLAWAAIQNSLGIALWRLGERESSTTRLEQAVDAYRAALTEYSRGHVPLAWAATQNNLGLALQALGERESGTARLEQAVEAYRAALTEYTRERVPLEWAATQNNLGNALQSLGARESGTERLEEAVEAYRAALTEYTRERVPLDWAMTQNNLGNALQTLGARESGTAQLEQAVEAYRAALIEYTRERVPLNWAMTQNNLGAALKTLGERESGTARLEQAVEAYRAALTERTREHVPLEWATTQNNLGNALRILGERESGTARLEQAVEALRAALTERTRKHVPLDWAQSTGNQGVALMHLAERQADFNLAEQAVAQLEAAFEVTRDGGHAPNAAYYEKVLPQARALRDKLKGQGSSV